jgi:hypothetical protein
MVQVVETLVGGPTSGATALHLLLLLRSSGDEGADRIRRNTLRSYSERMAATSDRLPKDGDPEELILRAQVALATVLGVVLLRSGSAIEPLTSATQDELGGPLGEVLRTLLG